MISDEKLEDVIQRSGDAEWLAPIKEMAAELLQRRADERKACTWKLNEDDYWDTECGATFCDQPGTTFRHCPYCGKKIKILEEA